MFQIMICIFSLYKSLSYQKTFMTFTAPNIKP